MKLILLAVASVIVAGQAWAGQAPYGAQKADIPISHRDRFYTADNMMEFFDFNNPSWLTPPPLPLQPWKNQQMVSAGAIPGPADPTAGTCNRNLEVAPVVP